MFAPLRLTLRSLTVLQPLGIGAETPASPRIDTYSNIYVQKHYKITADWVNFNQALDTGYSGHLRAVFPECLVQPYHSNVG